MFEEEEREFYSEEYRNLVDVEGHYLPQAARAFFEVELAPNAERLARAEKHLAPSSRCLEIGCAAGSFLYLLKQKCDDCVGIELHEAFSSFARNELGLTVFDRPVEEIEFPPGSIDAIFMWHVLEHFRDPSSFLKTLFRLLRKGGCLFLELPNVDDALLTLYRLESFSGFYYQPAHSYYFSRQTMARILKQAGFDYRIHMLQRYSALNHLHWIMQGKPQAKPAFKTRFPLSVLDRIYRTLLCALGRADTLFVVAQHPLGEGLATA
jgi:2-polyprenyl-3-methyl-5-hydroxy-6-metoxy-1,4-benzoquinol methylase